MKPPKPLTATEKKWLAELREVFSRCPDRLEFVTIGDADLTVVDAAASDAAEYVNGIPQHIIIGYLPTKALIHAVAS